MTGGVLDQEDAAELLSCHTIAGDNTPIGDVSKNQHPPNLLTRAANQLSRQNLLGHRHLRIRHPQTMRGRR